jgi:hypothetical protein
VRAIGLIGDQILTDHLVLTPSVRARSSPTPSEISQKIAVVERHHATGRIGLGPVRGFGLWRGAVATTVRTTRTTSRSPWTRRLRCAVERPAEIGGGIDYGRRVARGFAAAGRRPDVGLAGGGLPAALVTHAVVGARVDRGPVHDAQLPGAVGDPGAQDH